MRGLLGNVSDRREFFKEFYNEVARLYLIGYLFCVVFVAHVIAVLCIIHEIGYWSIVPAFASSVAAGAYLYLKKHGEI